MTTTHPDVQSPTSVPRATAWPVVLVPAGAVAAAGWVLADKVLGVALSTGTAPHTHPVGLASAIVVAMVVAACGAGLRRVLRGRTHPDRTWTLIAGAVLLVSLLGPLGGTTTSARLALVGLHLAVGATVILTVRRTFRRA
jgi:hypothetical protein